MPPEHAEIDHRQVPPHRARTSRPPSPTSVAASAALCHLSALLFRRSPESAHPHHHHDPQIAHVIPRRSGNNRISDLRQQRIASNRLERILHAQAALMRSLDGRRIHDRTRRRTVSIDSIASPRSALRLRRDPSQNARAIESELLISTTAARLVAHLHETPHHRRAGRAADVRCSDTRALEKIVGCVRGSPSRRRCCRRRHEIRVARRLRAAAASIVAVERTTRDSRVAKACQPLPSVSQAAPHFRAASRTRSRNCLQLRSAHQARQHCSRVDESGSVGPDPITSVIALGNVRDEQRALRRVASRARASRPPFTAERCLRSVFISAMLRPECTSAR